MFPLIMSVILLVAVLVLAGIWYVVRRPSKLKIDSRESPPPTNPRRKAEVRVPISKVKVPHPQRSPFQAGVVSGDQQVDADLSGKTASGLKSRLERITPVFVEPLGTDHYELDRPHAPADNGIAAHGLNLFRDAIGNRAPEVEIAKENGSEVHPLEANNQLPAPPDVIDESALQQSDCELPTVNEIDSEEAPKGAGPDAADVLPNDATWQSIPVGWRLNGAEDPESSTSAEIENGGEQVNSLPEIADDISARKSENEFAIVADAATLSVTEDAGNLTDPLGSDPPPSASDALDYAAVQPNDRESLPPREIVIEPIASGSDPEKSVLVSSGEMLRSDPAVIVAESGEATDISPLREVEYIEEHGVSIPSVDDVPSTVEVGNGVDSIAGEASANASDHGGHAGEISEGSDTIRAPNSDQTVLDTPADPAKEDASIAIIEVDSVDERRELELVSVDGQPDDPISSGDDIIQVEAGDATPIATEPPSSRLLPSGNGTGFQDRRGSRRRLDRKDRERAVGKSRISAQRGRADLRLALDPINKAASISVVLSRPDGFPETITPGLDGSVFAFDEKRYDDIDLDWDEGLLDGELRFRDVDGRFEWMRSSRPIHLFAAAVGETGLLTTSAASLNIDHVVVCRANIADTVMKLVSEAGSPTLIDCSDWAGVPAGWTVFQGYTPVRALETEIANDFRPLDPGHQISITLTEGLEVRSACYAEGRAPRIEITSLAENCRVLIDERAATQAGDGTWHVEGCGLPGKHLIDVVPGPSLTYEILSDPAREGWVPSDETEWPLILANSKICGAAIVPPEGYYVVATVSAQTIWALGAHGNAASIPMRRDVSAAIALLPFEPAFVVCTWGSRRTQGAVVWLGRTVVLIGRKPPDAAWCSVMKTALSRRLPVMPSGTRSSSAWKQAARRSKTRRASR